MHTAESGRWLLSALLLAAVADVALAAPRPVPDTWRAVDALAAVDVSTASPLSAPLSIDLASGTGADACPQGAWTGPATYTNTADGTLLYWGTGWFCIPHGIGTLQYPDGSTYFGRITSFLAAPDARLLHDSFRPAVPDGPGQRFFPATGVQQLGAFARGLLVRDLAPDPNFVARYAAAVNSLSDRTRPTLTPEVLAFLEVRPNVPPVAPPLAPVAAGLPPDLPPPVSGGTPAWEPGLVSRVEPEYPRAALRAGTQGRVVVEFQIRGDGTVAPDSVRILRAEPPRVFDDAVRAAVARWRFTPAPDGDATRRRAYEQTFTFRLED